MKFNIDKIDYHIKMEDKDLYFVYVINLNPRDMQNEITKIGWELYFAMYDFSHYCYELDIELQNDEIFYPMIMDFKDNKESYKSEQIEMNTKNFLKFKDKVEKKLKTVKYARFLEKQDKYLNPYFLLKEDTYYMFSCMKNLSLDYWEEGINLFLKYGFDKEKYFPDPIKKTDLQKLQKILINKNEIPEITEFKNKFQGLTDFILSNLHVTESFFCSIIHLIGFYKYFNNIKYETTLKKVINKKHSEGDFLNYLLELECLFKRFNLLEIDQDPSKFYQMLPDIKSELEKQE